MYGVQLGAALWALWGEAHIEKCAANDEWGAKYKVKEGDEEDDTKA